MKPKSIPVPSQARIRILVADDHPVARHGIIANLEPQPDMTVVADAGDGVEALDIIKQHLPDVAMLDLRTPRMDRLDVLKEVTTSKLPRDRKSTRLNSSHQIISYAVFCLKKKNDMMYIVRTAHD